MWSNTQGMFRREDGNKNNHKFVFLSLRKDYIEVIRWSENDNNDDDDRFLFGCTVHILTTVKMKKWPLGRRTSMSIQIFTQETMNVKSWARLNLFLEAAPLSFACVTPVRSGRCGCDIHNLWWKFNYQVSRQVLDYQPNTQQEIQHTCRHGGNANLEYCRWYLRGLYPGCNRKETSHILCLISKLLLWNSICLSELTENFCRNQAIAIGMKFDFD